MPKKEGLTKAMRQLEPKIFVLPTGLSDCPYRRVTSQQEAGIPSEKNLAEFWSLLMEQYPPNSGLLP